jgi:hypothetical protein
MLTWPSATCRRVRTPDMTPPVVLSLSVTFTPPMSFKLTANVSKDGQLYYIARKATDPAPTQTQVRAGASTSMCCASPCLWQHV